MTNNPDKPPKIEYFFANPDQMKVLQRSAQLFAGDVDVLSMPTDTTDDVQAAAKEWSEHEENSYHDDEDAFDYIRRTDRKSFEALNQQITRNRAIYHLVKVVLRNDSISSYDLLRDYYEPAHPHDRRNVSEHEGMLENLQKVFGSDGVRKLCGQIFHDDPALNKEQVIEYAYSLIPEAVAYMMPASQEDLTENAILKHEGYEAHRRVAE